MFCPSSHFAKEHRGDAKSAAPMQLAPLGATAESVLAAGRRLNPALRAAALDTSAAAAKVESAGALDDPMISDNYQFYRNPNSLAGTRSR
jgi:outer membrane protein, heavy metal efflux system